MKNCLTGTNDVEHWSIATVKRIYSRFFLKYQHNWLPNMDEANKKRILKEWTNIVLKMGEAKVAAVMKWLDSDENDKFTRFPPLPQEFLILYKNIPFYFDKNKIKQKEIEKDNLECQLKAHTGPTTKKNRILIGILHLRLTGRVRSEYEDIEECIRSKSAEWMIECEKLKFSANDSIENRSNALKKLLQEFDND